MKLPRNRRPDRADSSPREALVRVRRLTAKWRWQMAILVGALVLTGLYLISGGRAASQFAGLEAENGTVSGPASVHSSTSASGGQYVQFGAGSTPTPTPAPGKTKPVFVIYYMWWDHQHWVSHLGPNYPINQTPNPLPATLDSTGCGTVNNYTGNVLTDVSQGLAYDQDNYQTFLTDVQNAAATGVNGFVINWVGDGTSTQTASNVTYNKRLAYMFQAVHAVNAAGTPFKLMFNYQSSAKILTMTQFTNDFNYLLATYGSDSALDHTYSSKPEIIIAGTWKYTDADIQTISSQFRSKMYLVGDEKPASWDAARAQYLDGTSYYWSSQDPVKNPSSFTQLQNFAATIRTTKNPDGSAKTWFAPFTPGYNGMLLYNTTTCVPRSSGQTMHQLFDGNLASNPDGWTFISWNEISEGTYIVPLTRYGNSYTNTLKSLIQAGQ